MKQIKMPLPDLETQQSIVAEVDAEQCLVDANKELLQGFEETIKQTINRVWGESA
jgi:type I restriction enzyme M protein